jgi:hypothetical protein
MLSSQNSPTLDMPVASSGRLSESLRGLGFGGWEVARACVSGRRGAAAAGRGMWRSFPRAYRSCGSAKSDSPPHLIHLMTPNSASAVHIENRMLSHIIRSHAGRCAARSAHVTAPESSSTTTPSSATLALDRGKGK